MLQRTLFRASRQAARPIARCAQPAPALRQFAAMPMRMYSDAPAAAKEEPTAAEAAPADEAAKLKAVVESKDKEIVELKDKYMRSVADYRNLQERTKREVAAAKDFALQRFARDLIDSVDNFDRALTGVAPEKLEAGVNADLISLHEGLQMSERILMQTLKKHGLERFDPAAANEKFNPNVHEAVFMTPQPDKEDNTVFHTQQKGFTLNGRTLRAAKVGVVKNS